MSGRTNWVCSSTAVAVFALAAVVQAQDEQWLQYRSGPDAGSMSQSIKLATAKPADLETVQGKDGGALFGRWVTPMAKKGGVWFSLERSTAKGPWDRLTIDSNGNASLGDETAVKPTQKEADQSRFGPVKVVLQGEDGPVSFHLNFTVYQYSDNSTRCYVSSAGWYEGDITLDGVKTHCKVMDFTSNGTFNESSLDPYKADRITIGEKEGSGESLCVGRLIDINDTLYELDVARDGACVKLKKAQDARYGQVRVPAGIGRLTLTGTNGQFRRTPKDQVVRVPVGSYSMTDWTTGRKDDKGKQWNALGYTNGVNNRWTLDVTEDKEGALDIGEPFISQLTVRSTRDNHSFQQRLEGRLGEVISLSLSNGERPAPPKLVIRCNEGGYERTLNFAYG